MENYSRVKWSKGWFIPIIVFIFLFSAAVEAQQTGNGRDGPAIGLCGQTTRERLQSAGVLN